MQHGASSVRPRRRQHGEIMAESAIMLSLYQAQIQYLACQPAAAPVDPRLWMQQVEETSAYWQGHVSKLLKELYHCPQPLPTSSCSVGAREELARLRHALAEVQTHEQVLRRGLQASRRFHAFDG
eukprot:TRINITY_DN106977_c0_g1_i1.p1 TRINITY_DN106977_c0_g1~~TRINITY_DN106977_c0_g1_i1.p1  ORF type:complete len:125 (-),score=19.83 TRINITY_DN106977_c0_g1_i1:131-505(-)